MAVQFEVGICLLATLLAWCCLCVVVFMGGGQKGPGIDFLNPAFVLASLYLLYTNSVYLNPAMWEARGAVGHSFIAMMGLLGIVSGTALAQVWFWRTKQPYSPVVDQHLLLRWSIALTALSVVMIMVMNVRNMGLRALLQAGTTERFTAARGVLSGFYFLLPIGAGFATAGLLSRRGASRWVWLGVLFFPLLVLFYLNNNRSHILQTCFLAVFVYHYCFKRISNLAIVLAALSLIILMMAMSVMRPHLQDGPLSMFRALTLESLAERAQLQRFEFYFSGVRDVELVADGPPGGGFMWGTSLFYFIPNLVPAALAPWDRPMMLDRWYVWAYDPELARRGGGWCFSPVVDAYFNFGALGTFLHFALFSLCLSALHVTALRTRLSSLVRFTDCLLASTLIYVFRASISAFTKVYLLIFVGAGVLLLTLCIKRRLTGPLSAVAAASTNSLEHEAIESGQV